MTLTRLGWNERRQTDFKRIATEGLVPGRIIGEHRTHFEVTTATATVHALTSGRSRNESTQRTDLAGVGDFVALEMQGDKDAAVIAAVLPRSTSLIRKAAGEERPQLLAANVDVVFVVIALDAKPNMPGLERYLALVHSSGATAVVVANKTDLASDLNQQLQQIKDASSGATVHAIGARAADRLEQLEPYFTGDKTVALIGASGAGKSTLTNRLLGVEAQTTQAVRAHDNRGRHTTTHRQLFLRARGGLIMDMPGLRGLELWNFKEQTEPDFDDVEAVIKLCRFSDCQHNQEPGCAVRAAIDGGQLKPERVALYNENNAGRTDGKRYKRPTRAR